MLDLWRGFIIKEADWDGASKEVMGAMAKAAEEVMGRSEKGNVVAGDYLVLCRMYWMAGDKETALKWVRMAGKLEEDSPVGPYSVMVRRYVESVEAGALPTQEEIRGWGEEKTGK